MTKEKQRQIDELNSRVKVKIAPSKIHGVGVFAMRDIAKDETLYADATPKIYTLTYSELNKLRPEIREMIIEHWAPIINGSYFAFPTTRIQAYINHADRPNYDAQRDMMFKDVKSGEEITENYRCIKNYEKVFPFLD